MGETTKNAPQTVSAWRAGWESCRAQMVAATKTHAEMVGEKGGGSREGSAAMVAVLWLASLMEQAKPVPAPPGDSDV